MSQTRYQKRFTITKVAADWHELTIYRSALCGYPMPGPSNNWTCGLQLADIPPPKSATL